MLGALQVEDMNEKHTKFFVAFPETTECLPVKSTALLRFSPATPFYQYLTDCSHYSSITFNDSCGLPESRDDGSSISTQFPTSY